MSFKICPIVGNCNIKDRKTLVFAALELQKYFLKVTDCEFAVGACDGCEETDINTIYIGIGLSPNLAKVDDALLDDGIYINVKKFSGVITGTNARSVLIAVYRYLKEIGFSFIRPGENGENYPKTLDEREVVVSETASYRHRGICIEGSVFEKNIVDIIDWIPKAAMNRYLVQFMLPIAFFDRWYGNGELKDDDIKTFVERAEEEIEKRSLLYHAVGHGWTSHAFGINGFSWDEHGEPEEKYKMLLAEIDGKRKLFNGVPLNTNLCYSNPEARNLVTEAVVSYCEEHKNISYLHFWLADGTNNNCECDNCRNLRTSDYYVMMLNELDEKLTKLNIKTKIVFLIYVDLLWKPLKERMKNKERFTLMFAPISRSYTASFNSSELGEMKPYELNKLKFPSNVGENLAYLRDWQDSCCCDSFDFDYHFMWELYYDFAQYRVSKVLSDDIKNLKNVGLNGFISCQIQRAFLPTSLGMNVMADTLWNKEMSFDKIADEVLFAEFGKEYQKVKEFLFELSELECLRTLSRGDKNVYEKCTEKIKKAIRVIESFLLVISSEKASQKDDKKIKSWEKLKFFAELYEKMLRFYMCATKENVDDVRKDVRNFVKENEMSFKDEFDAWSFLNTFEHNICDGLIK